MFLSTSIRLRNVVTDRFKASDASIGLEFFTIILSKLDVMLQIIATSNISLGPWFLNIAKIGSKNPFERWFKFKTYDPTTTESIPAIPNGLGNSPTIIGDVIRRKTGVNVVIGSVRDSGESFIDFTNKRDEMVLSVDDVRSAIQKVALTDWNDPKKSARGRSIKRAKKRWDHAAESTLIFCAPLLFKALDKESKNELNKE